MRTCSDRGPEGEREEGVSPESARAALLIDLAYELLDAHSDTVGLASPIDDPAWEAHADYVRALQRRAREILAVASLQPREDPNAVRK